MNIRRTAHKEAVVELVELITIFSATALYTDFGWCIRDMVADGVTLGRILIASSLLISSIVVTYALVKYHYKQVKEHVAKALKEKLKHCRLKAKRKGDTK